MFLWRTYCPQKNVWKEPEMNINKMLLINNLYAEHLGILTKLKMPIADAKRLLKLNKSLNIVKAEIIEARDSQLEAYKGTIKDGKLDFDNLEDRSAFSVGWEKYVAEPYNLDEEDEITISPVQGQDLTAQTLLVFEDIIKING